MKRIITSLCAAVLCLAFALPASAQFKINKQKIISGAKKTVQALTLSDQQMNDYVKEYIDWMDANNPVLPDDAPYVIRLKKLTDGLTSVEGIPLNFKVYNVVDINAFACADGSVRVFAALMDLMNDDELLGIIGHEVGHVAHKDSKNAFKNALLTSALKDAVASTSDKAASLTDGQLGKLGEALASAKYSRKQENAADDYGYEFLKNAGKNPWAMAMSFRKLQQLEGEAKAKNGGKINQLFSSHPDTDLRIKRMEERATKDGIEKPADAQ